MIGYKLSQHTLMLKHKSKLNPIRESLSVKHFFGLRKATHARRERVRRSPWDEDGKRETLNSCGKLGFDSWSPPGKHPELHSKVQSSPKKDEFSRSSATRVFFFFLNVAEKRNV